MRYLSVVQAARHLGVTERTARNLIVRGELEVASADPIRLDPGHVAEVLAVRQEAALLELERVRKDPLVLARETRAFLDRPYNPVNLPQDRADDRKRRMGLVSEAAKALFGAAALAAAQEEGAGCRWCRMRTFADLPGMWAPKAYGEAFRELFGAPPCASCAATFYKPVLEALRGRVHPGGTAPSVGRSEPAAPVMWAESRQAAERVPAPARPVQADDGGKAAIQRRRRQVQERLKAANRAGDSRYADQLARMLEGLRADAAVADGRSAAPRGRKRCGTPVGVRCACHTSDRRGQR